RSHVLVGYQWSHTGLHPGRKTSHNRYIRSFVSQPPQIRACTSRAPGSSSHEFATRAIRRRYVDMVQVTMYLPGFSSTAHETAPPSLDGFLGLVPPLPRYYEVLRLPAAHFAALRFLRL